MHAALVVLVGRGLMAVSTMAIVVVVARFCTKDVTALYQLAFYASLLITLIGQGGMPNATMRHVALARNDGDPERYKRVAFAAVLWSFCLSLICIGVSIVVKFFFFPNAEYAELVGCIDLIAIWAGLLAMQVVIAELFRAHHRQIEATMFGGLVSQILTLLTLFLYLSWVKSPALKELVIFSILPVLISILVSCFFLVRRKYIQIYALSPLLKECVPLYGSGARLVGVGVLAYCILQSNVWIVAAISEAGDLALFTVANRLVSALSIISVVVSGAYMPSIAKLIVENRSFDLSLLVSKVALISSLLALSILVFIAIFAESIVLFLFGDGYFGSAAYLRILAFGFFLTSMTGLRSQILMVAGHEAVQLKITLVSALLYVTTVYTVGQVWGLTAAVWASTVLFGLIGAVEAYALYKKVGVVSLPFEYARHVYVR